MRPTKTTKWRAEILLTNIKRCCIGLVRAHSPLDSLTVRIIKMNKLVLLFLIGAILVVPNVNAQGGGASNWFTTLISRVANLFRRGPTTSSGSNNNVINQALQQQQAAQIEAQLQDQVNQALQLQAQQQETQTIFIPQEITMTEYLTSTSIVNVERNNELRYLGLNLFHSFFIVKDSPLLLRP